MEAEIKQGLFAEHATFAGNIYGTSYWALSNVEASGKVPVLEVDIQGAVQLEKRKDIRPVFCFIKPPSYQELENRLVKRGTENPEKIAKRLRQAKLELEFMDSPASSFFHVVLVNDNLERCLGCLKSEIRKHYPHLKEAS
mmetsp:Transcript_533/g.795  ORF Transcript_533/g.795 Transcript_533/m.795 type:complete len:140 (-) Transcript_533:193-612(-)